VKKIVFIFLILAVSNLCFAEGIWSVNGHVFSNVHAFQRGKEVTVSGRVSGGSAKKPLQARITLQTDEGRTYYTYATITDFKGQGEIFESRFYSYQKALWWKIANIETN
jgi:hypothetical protein